MLIAAAQAAVLIKIIAVRNPEGALENVAKLRTWEIILWRVSFAALLNSRLVHISDELSRDHLWDDVLTEARMRGLDRKSGIYRRKFNPAADRYNDYAEAAVGRHHRAIILGLVRGAIVLAFGLIITAAILRFQGS